MFDKDDRSAGHTAVMWSMSDYCNRGQELLKPAVTEAAKRNKAADNLSINTSDIRLVN
jgi:hypothetical protein